MHLLWLALLASGRLLLAPSSLHAAAPPGLSLFETIDLSPGADAYFPFQLAVNHATHKLYVPGLRTADTLYTPPDGGVGLGVKVINTTTNSAVAGIALGHYDDGSGNKIPFAPVAITVDESPAPLGNKVYVLGQVGDDRLFLRTIDGATDMNETDATTDLLLPVTGRDGSFSSMTVNPTNHKVYISDDSGDVVVVDGPTGTVLTTLHGVGADYSHVLVANPITNKVFVFCFRSSVVVIDSTDDSYTSFATNYFFDPVSEMTTGIVSVGMVPGNAAIDSRTGQGFVVDQTGNTVTVVNGAEGEKAATIEGTANSVRSVAVDDLTNTVFLGCFSVTPDPHGWVSVFDGNNSYASLGEIEVGHYPERMAFNTATRQLFVSNNQDGTISVLQSDTPAPPDRLANISTRLGVETDDNVLIGGFIITGPEESTKRVLIRGIGPSLTDLGVSGALADPFLELHSGPSTIATNDNWKIDQNGKSQQAAIEATTIPPTNDFESAILVNLAPGSYTAIMRGTNRGTGVGLVEAYDLTASATTKMVNISTRGRVDTGDNVMIGGLIVTGASPSRVIIRAIGPSLAAVGVAGALQDPVLELHNDQGVLITTNDNWKDDNQAEILATGIPPSDDRESAIVTTLYPSSYTAIVRGKDNTTGVGLVEAYYLP